MLSVYKDRSAVVVTDSTPLCTDYSMRPQKGEDNRGEENRQSMDGERGM